jgi:hypothetical protein
MGAVRRSATHITARDRALFAGGTGDEDDLPPSDAI